MARISSLEDLKKKQEKEEEEEKKENQYFAGGLDQRGGGSGLAVQAPPQGGGRPNPRLGAGGVGGDPHDLLHGIIDKASDPNNGPPPPSSSSSGGGRGVEPVVFEVALYRNGIIVNNGPFRDISNPEVQRFLTSLYRGEIPEELAQQMNAASASSSSTGGPREVDLKLTNKIEEDYVPPAYVAFSGVANSLGGGGSSNTEAFIFSNDLLRGIPVPVLDESQGGGVINVQLRTHDNKRLKLRINGNITIAAFAALILKEIGGQGKAIRFILSAGFPPKDILDPTITVSEAGFAGAAITMKLA